MDDRERRTSGQADATARDVMVTAPSHQSDAARAGAGVVPPGTAVTATDGAHAAAEAPGDMLDRAFHHQIARMTGGLSPAALIQTYLDWYIHLAASPGRQVALWEKGVGNTLKLWQYMSNCALHGGQDGAPCAMPATHDSRFRSPNWQTPPFNAIHQSFLLTEQWWHAATTDVRGVSDHHTRVMDFMMRQMLDVFAPSNFIWTNPDVLQRTQEEGGRNLIRGATNLVEDWRRWISGDAPAGVENFVVGKDVAATPGKVIYRNRLIELLQYEPQTETVHPEPVLIVPAWIMKYYILDLSAHNSLIGYLVARGFTVFAISWKNPDADDRDLGFDDYVSLGIDAALDAIARVTGKAPVHAAGYCLGGTLLSMAAAAHERKRDSRFASLTFLAAQTDFTEAGELTLFTSESQVAFLEDMMREQGYLDSSHMAGAFQMLRSSDLIWSRMVRDYLMGERQSPNDMMAWNADATRMPYRMHSEYLRRLFLHNDLAEGRFKINGETIAIGDIRAPAFLVGTETDHVAPWRSVFKLNLMLDGDVTSVLTSGGHNAGIVSEPGHPHRHFRIARKDEGAPFEDADSYMVKAEVREGSWWPAWADWLAAQSGGLVAPPRMGGSADMLLQDAPGSYVLQK